MLTKRGYDNTRLPDKQLDKYNVNIRQGQDIQIGNHFYVEWNDEAIPALQKST
ncbi:MAG: hypothetical protein RH949_32195 [Coleofasciculus sp. A1-SPW-01]|uniref:hypothetical protein n=1 Tax=Coleofasciculus sp. A1-SPW-01 TaxID=3070819 RepID=UPI0032F8A365